MQFFLDVLLFLDLLWCCAMLHLDFEVAFFAFSSIDNDQVKRHLQTRIALGDVTECQGKYKAGQKGRANGGAQNLDNKRCI